MRFASLGSGSEGNALLVEVRAGVVCSRVLLDCGFALKETERRLARLEIPPESLDAIVVTHEHSDHLSGVFRLARRHHIPVWSTHGTLRGTDARTFEGVQVHYCRPGAGFAVGNLSLMPYAVPHDAREPVQYVFSDGSKRLGVLTDAGRCTTHIVGMLDGCDALVLECNHDRQMLEKSNYPAALKLRIQGDFGHLANDVAAQILEAINRSRLNVVVAAHLSQNNNTPDLAREALAKVLACQPQDVLVADQHLGLDWMTV